MTDGIGRVNYFPQQFLRSKDFVAEQSFHLAAHRRHNIGQHTWGIAVGLQLTKDDEGRLYVEAGAAVDGFGRDIVLAQRQQIGTEVFAERDSDVLDVFLNYNRIGSDETPEGYAGCGDGGAESFYRWQEQPFLTFMVPPVPPVDRRNPPDVSRLDASFDATRVPPDEPERRWPVFLGQISVDRANEADPFTVDLAGRPYVGLVGEMVSAPSGRTRVQVGAERPNDPNRFAVYVPEAETKTTKDQPRLAIDKDGNADLLGDTTLRGDLTVDGHAVTFESGPKSDNDGHPRMYHVEVADDGGPHHELRIEMVDKSVRNQEVVIGTWSAEDSQFIPCLTISNNDCTVTVHGDLVVEGLTEGFDTNNVVDAGLGEEAQRLVTSSFASGIIGANALLSDVYRSPFGGVPDGVLLSAATAFARASPQQRDMIAHLLKTQHPDTAAALRVALAAEAPNDTAGYEGDST